MQSSNPVLGRAFPKKGYAAQPPLFGRRTEDALENIYNAPSASSLQTGRMTIEDVVARTSFLFAILVAVGGTAWYFNMGMGVMLVGFIGAFILAMVNIFSKTVRPALIIAYAAFEGLALGTLSHFYETIYPGIVSQAIIGTLAAFAGVLFMYRSGRLRATPKFTRVLMGAAIGYIVLGLVSFISSFFGVGGGYGFYGTGIGLGIDVPTVDDIIGGNVGFQFGPVGNTGFGGSGGAPAPDADIQFGIVGGGGFGGLGGGGRHGFRWWWCAVHRTKGSRATLRWRKRCACCLCNPLLCLRLLWCSGG